MNSYKVLLEFHPTHAYTPGVWFESFVYKVWSVYRVVSRLGLMVFFTYLVGASFSFCWAFHFADASKGEAPLTIEAQQGITCEKKGRMCTARGHVVVTHGETRLTADLVRVIFVINDQGLPKELERIEAQGNVHFTTTDGTHQGFAQKALYEVATGHAHLTGKGLRLIFDDLQITAQKALDYFEQTQQAVATGDVRAQKDDQRLSAQVLTAFLRPGSQGSPSQDAQAGSNTWKLTRVTAKGDVLLTTPTASAHCAEALYTVAEEIVRLKGGVTLTREDGQIEGDQAEMNLQSGVSHVFASGRSGEQSSERGGEGTSAPASRVKILLKPQKKSSPRFQ